MELELWPAHAQHRLGLANYSVGGLAEGHLSCLLWPL